MATEWICALELDGDRQVVAGSSSALADAIRNGSDLRIGTRFRHNEHIDVASSSNEPIDEVAEFAVTYFVDGRWSAGIMTQRQPVKLPVGFGPRPSMSYFLYNENGDQAMARLLMDGAPALGPPGPSPASAPTDMPKYHPGLCWDDETNAPSRNFVYDFDFYRYFVCNRWRQVLAHDAEGGITQGSVQDLSAAFVSGHAIKIGISGLATELCDRAMMDHEIFVEIGSGYFYTEQNLFIAGSHPLVRVAPEIPMAYRSGGWDAGWLVVRTDGHVVYRRCDPYRLTFDDRQVRCAIRWFVA